MSVVIDQLSALADRKSTCRVACDRRSDKVGLGITEKLDAEHMGSPRSWAKIDCMDRAGSDLPRGGVDTILGTARI